MALSRFPELASHPALVELATLNPRFIATVDIADPDHRFQAAAALTRATVPGSPAAVVVGQMASVLRAPDYDGQVRVDVSGVDVLARTNVVRVLRDVAHDAPQVVSGPLVALLHAWEGFALQGLSEPPRPPTPAERDLQERTAVRRARERVVDDA